MRFMVIVKATGEYGSPSPEELAEMGRYNEKLIEAGIMKAGEGLLPPSKGALVRFSKAGPTVVDGPFSETKELIGGFWILDVKSKEECLEWVKQIPFGEGEVEVRQIAEVEDFTRDEVSAPALDQEKAWRERGDWDQQIG